MKKKMIILLLISLFPIGLLAQSALVLFQVEKQNHLLINGLSPNASMEEYSTRQGGALMNNVKLDDKGSAHLIYNIRKTPAFLLNRKTVENTNGNNQVSFLGNLEFIAQDIVLNNIAEKIIITWDAQVFDNNISFQIVKQVDAKEKVLKTMLASQYSALLGYYFEADYDPNANYHLKIFKNNTEFRYASKALIAAGENNIVVYPTLSRELLYVRLQQANYSRYKIANIQGAIVKEGIFRKLNNKISTNDLNAGQYIITIQDEGNANQSFKFLKLD